jgi:hypothetical protein
LWARIRGQITDEEWSMLEQAERQRWQEWAIFAAEQERARRMHELKVLEEVRPRHALTAPLSQLGPTDADGAGRCRRR